MSMKPRKGYEKIAARSDRRIALDIVTGLVTFIIAVSILVAASGCAAVDPRGYKSLQLKKTMGQIQTLCDSGEITQLDCINLHIDALGETNNNVDPAAAARREIDNYKRCVQFVDSTGFLC